MNGEREEETTRLIWSRASHLNAAPFLQRKRPSTPRILPKMSSNLDLATIRLNIFNSSCPKRLEIMQYGIVVFRYIAIRPKLGHSRALEAFLEEPSAEDELFLLSKGFFTLYCHGDVDRVEEKLLKADEDYTLITWKIAFEAVNPWQFLRLGGHPSVQAGHYLAIQRNEFANVYWTIVDLLDIFITSQSLGIEPDKLNIILMDAHPKTSLDPFWTVLFQRLIKLTDPIFVESNCVLFENLLWRYPPAKSPLLDSSLNSLKHIQPFRSFVLRRFGISSGTHFRKCNQLNLNILFILRRDYKSHPRNLAGIIDRKIANEEDVLSEIKSSFPDANITPVQLDLLTLKAQLEIVAKTDILFGMHGAAHAFSIFMPPGGAVVEMFHHNSNIYNWHMNKIATLSDHSYINWENTDMRAVDTLRKSIVIPRGVSYRLLRMAIDSICPNSN
ncbi:uncharacterized protein LOC111332657 [Stylophora pistillata]|uniref:uncharacterized protein LOC111332657 n=1 Tax=Stylophora pistillata TaxID=50429 RepID=UPI000C055A42|nr:uncharacterized protein LOC111332657 [Stylophora pistillata]